ncbi:MAG TPA: sulfatase-like hydrolase/transferase [Caulifigura sp.]|nr:sulfatase-like hydrolase/transferase [Caulifigura sp.]
MIITDDQGYADAGFQGSPEIVTPHLDALARSGVVCTSGYVTAPVCAPSRAGLLTGRYQQRTGFHDNAWSPLVGLATNATTIADVLHSGGYATCAIGKWHMGQLPEYRPLVRGFTEHYGFLGGGRSFLPLKESQGVAFVPKDPDQVDLWRNETRGDDPAYVTDAFADEAVASIRRHKETPFLLYVAFNAPHVPLQATEKYLSRFPNLTGARRTYAAMLSAVDDAIGRISDTLQETGLEHDTIVFFLSDNGGHPLANTGRNAPLRGEKSTLYEGGIRVPFLVKWPGTLPAGKRYDSPVISLDIMATAIAAAGLKPAGDQPLDGVNLIPHLRGDVAAPPHETLYWRFIQHRAIRHQNWKLTMPSDGPVGLFDLGTDVSESNDQSSTHPDIVKQLTTMHAAWESQMPPVTPVPRKPRPVQN